MIPGSSTVLRPFEVTVTVYVPGRTDGKSKYPAPFVTVFRSTPVASFFRTTFAAGRMPPAASVTVAPIEPLANWANAGS